MADYELDAAILLDAARQATGLDDFGDERFRKGLDVVVATYAMTAGLDERGLKMNWKRLVQLLATRLRIEAAFERHPEIRRREIRRPVYLTGLPRTGTSALFNLLGMDPAARPLLLWEGFFPDPLDGHPDGEPDPRHVAMKATYERMRANSPDFTKIHFADADTPEECVLLLAHSFENVHLGIEVLMEPYRSYFQGLDLRPSYAYYADLLRMVDWQRPGERWLLKSPAHLWALDALVEEFPDCCIILTHRDPVESVASYCSMMETLLQARGCSPQPDLGPTVLEFLARSLERGYDARDRCDPARFLDVRFADFVEDPIRVAEHVYAHFGLPLTAEAGAAMRAHVDANPKGKHGAHEYELERYGLSEAHVRDRLRTYIERHALA